MKKRSNWLSVIFITIFYDLFIYDNKHDFLYGEEWLNKRLTAVGKVRSNKILKKLTIIKSIIAGLIFAVIIINIGFYDIVTTIAILLDLIVVALIIWSNKK